MQNLARKRKAGKLSARAYCSHAPMMRSTLTQIVEVAAEHLETRQANYRRE